MATRYLLDTNICIYIARRRPPEVARRFETLRPGDLVMSLITYGELRYGAEKSHHPEQAREKLDRLVELVPVHALPPQVGEHYGRLRACLEAAGTPIGANDLWIAAHALAEGWILVTNNTREFARIDGLALENWVDPPSPLPA